MHFDILSTCLSAMYLVLVLNFWYLIQRCIKLSNHWWQVLLLGGKYCYLYFINQMCITLVIVKLIKNSKTAHSRGQKVLHLIICTILTRYTVLDANIIKFQNFNCVCFLLQLHIVYVTINLIS